jgi:hypothetical protein
MNYSAVEISNFPGAPVASAEALASFLSGIHKPVLKLLRLTLLREARRSNSSVPVWAHEKGSVWTLGRAPIRKAIIGSFW